MPAQFSPSQTPAAGKNPAINVEGASPSPTLVKARDEPSDDDDTVLLDTDCLTQQTVKHTNGLRPVMLEKQALVDAAADSAEQIKKGNQKEFPVDSYLVDRLVKNIQKRSEDHSLKAMKRINWYTKSPNVLSKKKAMKADGSPEPATE